jgi:hypothetical protein
MATYLGTHFREQRERLGLSLGQLARFVGYRNASKGANKLVRLEREGIVEELLLVGLAGVLGLEPSRIQSLIEQDRQEYLHAWEAWVNQPVPMQLIVKYMPAVYGTVPMPDEVTTPEQAEAFAREYAQRHGRSVCLAVSRLLSVWIDKGGNVEARTEATPGCPNTPFMRLKGSGRMFLAGFGEVGEKWN